MNPIKLPFRGYLFICLSLFALSALAQTGAKTNDQRIAPNLTGVIKQYPSREKQGAEVLLRKTNISVNESHLAVTQTYVAIAIHDAEASRDYSQIQISFDDHFEDLSLNFAQVLTPEGKIEAVAKDALQIQSPSQEDFYQDSKVLTFSLPNVRPGSVIEFQYKRVDTKAIVPGLFFARMTSNWWQPKAANQGGRLDPMVYRDITIDAPSTMPLSIKTLGPKVFKHSSKIQGKRKHWYWQTNKLPEVKLQSWMPRDTNWTPQVMISSDKSWRSIVDWSKNLFSPHLKLDKNLQVEVDKIKKQQLAPEARVRAVYALLDERVRYVFAHVGRGGYEPHSAPEVFKQGYGDCKDQTILSVALLNALDIKASPALVVTRDYGRPNLLLPGIYFNHMVTYIPAQQGITETWLDTTGESLLYPGSNFSLEGQPALIISEETESITQIQKAGTKKHWAKVKLDYIPPTKSEPYKVSMSVQLGGIFEQNIRSTWRYAAEKDQAMSNAFVGIFSNAEFDNLQVHNANSLDKGVVVSADWIFDKGWEDEAVPSANFSITQLIGTFTGVAQWHKPQDRLQPFEFSPGLWLEVEVNFLSDTEKLFPERLTSGPNIENQWFTLKQKSEQMGTTLAIKSSIEIPAKEFTVTEYKFFYDTLLALEKEPGFSVIYNRKHRITSDQPSPALVRQLVANGKFEEALKVATLLVSENAINGEYYYVLGLAQGYSNNLDASSKSFALAESLGYTAP